MIETVPSGTILNGRYRIERVLGSGGFGHVYLALDQNLNQPVALKEYLVSGPSGQEQLMHEANVLSQLHHPNLPAFHDAFHEHGRYYVVLNYIEGNDLTDIIRNTNKHNGVIPISQIMTWILATCDAVYFLHSQQPPVIHRDIKPDNIRIMSNGTAILVDLGNAKAAADGARTLFFIRHQGTPGYAPPEQYPGGSGTDTRSDIYALGGTLYFALTGQEPASVSSRNQSMQQGQVDLPSLQEVLARNPAEGEENPAKQFRLGVSKPSKPAPRHSRHLAQLATLGPATLAQLNLVIQRAMAMRPRDRYQSVADFANDLQKVVANMPGSSGGLNDTPSVGSTQNPYKTQPDLPMVYDMLQQAKAVQVHQQDSESSARQMPSNMQSGQAVGVPQAPVTPPIPLTQETCPHCGGLHKVSASFCPHCGASLHNDQGLSNSGNVRAVSSMQQTRQPSTVASTIPQDQQNATQQDAFVAQMPSVATSDTTQVQQTAAESVAPWNTASSSPRTDSISRTSSPSRQNTQPASRSSSPSIGLLLVIVLLVILIALVIILVVLLIQHAHEAVIPLQYQLALIGW